MIRCTLCPGICQARNTRELIDTSAHIVISSSLILSKLPFTISLTLSLKSPPTAACLFGNWADVAFLSPPTIASFQTSKMVPLSNDSLSFHNLSCLAVRPNEMKPPIRAEPTIRWDKIGILVLLLVFKFCNR